MPRVLVGKPALLPLIGEIPCRDVQTGGFGGGRMHIQAHNEAFSNKRLDATCKNI